MSYPSNVPTIQIGENGISVPKTSDILNGVLKDFNAAFGGNLNITNVGTPQYYLSEEITACIVDLNAALAYLFNGVDPSYADGKMQDAIARIYFLTRKPATPTTVKCLCNGTPNSTLPIGSKAKDDNGNLYSSKEYAYFDENGAAEVEFVCDTPGPISCPIGSLSRIHQKISGWDAITNEVPGIPGSPVENRESFEKRRFNSVAKNAIGTVQSILGTVFDLPDVTDCYVLDNPTGEIKKVGCTDYPLKPHSVYVAVVGGKKEEIAKAIWTKKDVGCDMNGNTTVTIKDDSSLKEPYPIYDITFHRPTPVPIKFHVKLKKNAAIPSDVDVLIKEALVKTFNGGTKGMDRERIASTIFASKYYGVITSISQYIDIISILIGSEEINKSIIDIGVDQYPTIDPNHITVEIVE